MRPTRVNACLTTGLTLLVFFLCFQTVTTTTVKAATYYLTNNSQVNEGWGIGSDENDGLTKQSPFRTLQHALGTSENPVMTAGDVLIVASGVYTRTNSNDRSYVIDKFSYLPQGNNGPDSIDGTTDDVYTTIQAEHDGRVIIDGISYSFSGRETIDGNTPGDDYRYPNNFMVLKGFVFINARGMAISIRNAKYVKIINCGATGLETINSGSSLMGMGYASYCLFEGCYAWGNTGYYVMQATHCDHSIWRNCVVRYDRSNSTDNAQCGGLANYSSANQEIQNCIIIDGDTGWEHLGAYSGTQGCFANPGTSERYDSTSYAPNRFTNCIALNNSQRFSTSDRGSGVGEHDGIAYDYRNFCQFENCIGWDLNMPPGKSVRLTIDGTDDLCYTNDEWNDLLGIIRNPDPNDITVRIIHDNFSDKDLLDAFINGTITHTHTIDGVAYTYTFDFSEWPTNVYGRPSNEKFTLLNLMRKIEASFAEAFNSVRGDPHFCEMDGFSDIDFTGASLVNEKLASLLNAAIITRNPDHTIHVKASLNDAEKYQVELYNLLVLSFLYKQIHTLRPTSFAGSEGWCSYNQCTFGNASTFNGKPHSTNRINKGLFTGTGGYNGATNCIIENINVGNLFRSFELLQSINITNFSTTDYSFVKKPVYYNGIRVDHVTNLLSHPFSNRYLPLLPDESPLHSGGENNAQVGASIIYQYGKSGTVWGEDGYNKLQDGTDGQEIVSLWPFPNEDIMKEHMRTYSYSDPNGVRPAITGARGFCADGKQLNGVDDITLTSYIWEYLGNKIPRDIYNTRQAGDINGDGTVDPADVILALQVASGMEPAGITLVGDANDDSIIGMAEAIVALRKTGI